MQRTRTARAPPGGPAVGPPRVAGLTRPFRTTMAGHSTSAGRRQDTALIQKLKLVLRLQGEAGEAGTPSAAAGRGGAGQGLGALRRDRKWEARPRGRGAAGGDVRDVTLVTVTRFPRLARQFGAVSRHAARSRSHGAVSPGGARRGRG